MYCWPEVNRDGGVVLNGTNGRYSPVCTMWWTTTCWGILAEWTPTLACPNATQSMLWRVVWLASVSVYALLSAVERLRGWQFKGWTMRGWILDHSRVPYKKSFSSFKTSGIWSVLNLITLHTVQRQPDVIFKWLCVKRKAVSHWQLL